MRTRGVGIFSLMLWVSGCKAKPGIVETEDVVEKEGPRLTLARLFEDPPLDGVSLKGIQWTEDGSRVGFLRPSSENRDVLELWVYEGGESRLLIKAEDVLPEVELSDEQIQQLERKRITERGITSYLWAPDGRSVLLPMGSDLYLYGMEEKAARKLEIGEGDPPMDPRFSPDGRKVSYVRGGEIWVLGLEGGTPRRLTKGAGETITHGLAEFVAMEEMGRYRGYWWSPDSSRIAFLEVDESGVEVWKRASYQSGESYVAEQRYPGAGRPNAVVRAGIVEVANGWTYWADLGEYEYIARVDWAPGGETLVVQVQSRDQKSLKVLGVNPATMKSSVMLEETSKTYVNLHDDLRFLEDGRFLWSSERSGSRQLYLMSPEGKVMTQLTDMQEPVVELEGVDEDAGRAIFSAVQRRSLQLQLFAVSLEGGEVVQLTPEGGWHSVEAADDGKTFVDVFSSRTSPPRAVIRDSGGDEVAVIWQNPTPELDGYMRAGSTFLEVKAADGRTQLNAEMIRPPDFDEARRYPVIIYGYGGPHGHVVADRWSRSVPWHQFLAQEGYIVFSVDPRGGNYRGKEFEEAIHERFGVVEVVDHRAAVEHLRTLPYVDGERIGIWGWSYGGTLVLMSLIETEGMYRCGVAVAPVTDWHLYDTHYTERYLGMPDTNAGVYSAASPVEKDPAAITEKLLLVHGMADDNVFLGNSLAFMQKLQDAGVQFDLMLYPGKTHLIAGKATRLHLYALMFGFFEEQLKSGF